MPIDVTCQCGQKLRVADDFAGRRAKCPKCQNIVHIPLSSTGPASTGPASTAPASFSATSMAPTGQVLNNPFAASATAAANSNDPHAWYMQTGDGQRFGPISKTQLDHWMAEGRIDHECQILQQGWEQWRWADQVYPELAADLSAASNVSHGQSASPAIAPSGATKADSSGTSGTYALQPSARPSVTSAPGVLAPHSSAGALSYPGSAIPAQNPANPYASPQYSSPRNAVSREEADDRFSGGFVQQLADTRIWAIVVGVFFLILSVFYGIGGLISLFGLLRLTPRAFGEFIGSMIGLSIVLSYTIYSFRFASRIQEFTATNSMRSLEEAMHAQKCVWRLTGIGFLVGVVGFFLLLILAGLMLR